MSTNDVPNATEAFAAMVADPAACRSFLAGIGSSQAPSRARAVALLDGCGSVLDVGCGPAVMFDALQEASPGAPLKYVGIDPVEAMVSMARERTGLAAQMAAEPFCLTEWSASPARASMLFHVDPAAALLHCLPKKFDGVLVRHVLEHLRNPWPLLQSAAAASARHLVVILSQPTRVEGLPMPLLTDRYLGALRWSHWRPFITNTMRSVGGWNLESRESGAPLVAGEELYHWTRA